jgi:RNA polymerase sigma-70 factor (ECF subfamily)
MSSGQDDIELIRRAVSGDQEAAAELLFSHYDSVVHHIDLEMPRWMKRFVDVEDILQEAYGEAFQDVCRFEVRPEQSFIAWLKRIASNRLHDMRRKLEAKKRPSPRKTAQASSKSVVALIEELTGSIDQPSSVGAAHERWQALHVGIAGLPEDQQEAIRLYSLEQRSLEEVAATMCRSPGALRGLVHRAKQALREHMGRSSLWYSKR